MSEVSSFGLGVNSVLIGWLLMVACGLQPSGGQDGIAYEPDNEFDRGGSGGTFIYPSAADDKIFLYTGHGGEQLVQSEGLESLWADAGWTVEADYVWPTSFDRIRLFMMLKVGTRAAVDFSESEIADISAALKDGTRVVIAQHADNIGCTTPSVLALLDDGLDAPVYLGWQSGGSVEPELFDVSEGAHQPTAGVDSLSMTNPCRMSDSEGVLVENSAGDPVMIQHRPGIAGDLILIGDVSMLEGAGLSSGDNRNFARNLAAIRPE